MAKLVFSDEPHPLMSCGPTSNVGNLRRLILFAGTATCATTGATPPKFRGETPGPWQDYLSEIIEPPECLTARDINDSYE
ncbi:hypothetical protein CMO91_05210 [Candidatus Woesearchaeota archaeon]|nr:hypothetical protein [Candidatus Woesearchaeota archaeon]